MCEKYLRGIGFYIWKIGMGVPLDMEEVKDRNPWNPVAEKDKMIQKKINNNSLRLDTFEIYLKGSNAFETYLQY